MDDVPLRLPHQNGSLCSDGEATPSPSNPSSPLPLPIPSENWRIAERATQRIIWMIQPTRVSEERRKEVVEYVQQLLRYHLGEVFPFGSVPLKTYLPDGDIDLTALGPSYIEESLAEKVNAILEGEEYNMDAKFEVKDIQIIHAEVKLVKCLVQNIVVDISFNQIGGLSTLCFLEQVDNLIGKNYLFKRSIILIKAWCYYESRILGAHHGLLSTYALETLVLYIFHRFNSSLHGPLAVLHRFLDYFSRFDWDNFAISLCGPVRLSSLPEIVVEEPEINGEDLLLSGQFLNRCKQMFSVPPRVSESHKPFIRKHLNIVDPLKENNNLGRSVSKGNLYRIRSAFTYGAKKLGFLLLSRDGIITELSNFFKNAQERHEDGERPDVQQANLRFPHHTTSNYDSTDATISLESSLLKDVRDSKKHLTELDDLRKRLCDDISSIDILSSEKGGDQGIGPTKAGDESPEAPALSDNYSKRDADKPTPDMTHDSIVVNETSKELPTNVKGNAFFAPHLFFSQGNGNTAFPQRVEPPFDSRISNGGTNLDGNDSHGEDMGSVISDLADLSSSLEKHQKNLLYAQSYVECFLNGSLPPGNTSFSSQVHSQQHWETVQYDMSYLNGAPQNPSFSPRSHYQIYPGYFLGPYSVINLSKPRGTGTFLPNTSHIEYKERLSTPSGIRKTCCDSLAATPLESCSAYRGDHEQLDQPRVLISGENDPAKPGSAEAFQSSNLLLKGIPQVNGLMIPSDNRLEFGSFQPNSQVCHPHLEVKLDSTVARDQTNGSAACSTVQRSRIRSNSQRMTQTYHLKDEDEFPPLSSRGVANGSMSNDGNACRAMWEAKKE